MATAESEERSNPTVEEEEESVDDPPLLSSRALEALSEFLNEQKQRPSHGEEEEEEAVSLVSEDWRLSQFWYDRETAETVATELKNLSISISSPVACVACPTLYAYLKVASFYLCKLFSSFFSFCFMGCVWMYIT